MTPQASHICPKCREPQVAEAFINAQGKLAKWCSWCREGYRDRLTKLHQPKRGDEAQLATPAWEAIAKAEGYEGHPLAHLLALAHLAGYKQRMGIQYRKAWLGKKAWRAYNDAKRELAKHMEDYPVCVKCPKVLGDCGCDGPQGTIPASLMRRIQSYGAKKLWDKIIEITDHLDAESDPKLPGVS